jgi:Family of unknown function (DUF6364)
MKAKLTLSIDEDVLPMAKRKAKINNRSLSEIVKDYLKSNISNEKKDTPITDSLTGILKGKIPNKPYKELRKMMFKDKYGV